MQKSGATAECIAPLPTGLPKEERLKNKDTSPLCHLRVKFTSWRVFYRSVRLYYSTKMNVDSSA